MPAHYHPDAERVTRLLEDMADRMALLPTMTLDVALSAYDRATDPVDLVLSVTDASEIAVDEGGPDVVAQLRAVLVPGYLDSLLTDMQREDDAAALEKLARDVRSGRVCAFFLVYAVDGDGGYDLDGDCDMVSTYGPDEDEEMTDFLLAGVDDLARECRLRQRVRLAKRKG